VDEHISHTRVLFSLAVMALLSAQCVVPTTVLAEGGGGSGSTVKCPGTDGGGGGGPCTPNPGCPSLGTAAPDDSRTDPNPRDWVFTIGSLTAGGDGGQAVFGPCYGDLRTFLDVSDVVAQHYNQPQTRTGCTYSGADYPTCSAVTCTGSWTDTGNPVSGTSHTDTATLVSHTTTITWYTDGVEGLPSSSVPGTYSVCAGVTDTASGETKYTANLQVTIKCSCDE